MSTLEKFIPGVGEWEIKHPVNNWNHLTPLLERDPFVLPVLVYLFESETKIPRISINGFLVV